MSINLTVLGCHSATPRANAFPSSQFIQIKGRSFLIDCGEGTQIQLRKVGVSYSKISRIFISHLHGDHFYGLIGLISTFSLLKRDKELHIYAPKGLKEIILQQLKVSNSWTPYPLLFHVLESDTQELIFEDDKVSVYTIPLSHRIYTNGFLFKEKKSERKLNIQAVENYPDIDICDYHNIKKGQDFILSNGERIKNSDLTLDPAEPLSYAYCSDTVYDTQIIEFIKKVNCLYHETTFLTMDEELASSTMHTTASQAAMIAKKGNVKQLIIGHYSSRYKNKEDFLVEAKQHFENTFLSADCKEFVIS